MPPRPLILLLATGFSLSASAVEKGYHLWYDDLGQAVYSQFLPPDGRESTLVAAPPPPAEPPEVAKARLDAQLQKFDDNREDEQLQAEKTATIDTLAQQKKARCDAARSNLELLNGPPGLLFKTPDGIRRLTDEDRRAQRTAMEAIVAESCA